MGLTKRLFWMTLAIAVGTPASGHAQSVVVDEGTFIIRVDGREAGMERFTIRRAGIGDDAIVISHAVVTLDRDDGSVELTPLLETLIPDGAASKYQLKVTGAESTEMSLALAGRRYVSRIRTDAGEEEREFLARPQTHILEEDVAHHYYFLRSAREGARIPIIEPHTRRQLQLSVGPSTEDELRVGATRIQVRRVTLSNGDEERVVWFDRQGRVVRLEVPARGYVAQRDDLVG